MKKTTYAQAYNLIIDAYFKDEINPGNPFFCFCGTLCDNTHAWYGSRMSGYHYGSHGYTGDDFVRMEKALCSNQRNKGNDPHYEDSLFNGMCAALEVLKEIHRSRGEDVDSVPEFTKRQLQTT